MSAYAFNNLLLMSRTIGYTATATATVGDAITIPTITVDGTVHRPIGFSITEASTDISLLIGTATDFGAAMLVDSSELDAGHYLNFDLGPDDLVVLSDGAGTATYVIIWYWPNKVRDGIGVGNFDNVVLPIKTFLYDITSTEAFISIPTGAVAMVITGMEATAEVLEWRVDDPDNYDTAFGDQDFLRFENTSGSQVDIVSDAGDMPILGSGDYLYVVGFSVDGNNGLYQVDTVNTIRENYTCTKFSGLPVDAPNETNAEVHTMNDGDPVLSGPYDTLFVNPTGEPYVIWVNDGDRLRMAITTSDTEIYGYWRIAR